MEQLTAYINAGGQGTRLQDIFEPDPQKGLAKALLEVGTPPLSLVDHHVTKLLEAGMGRIIVGAAHQHGVADYITERYGDNGRVFPSRTERQMGTAAELIATMKRQPELFGDLVYICNVDTILDIDESDMLRSHRAGGKALSIALTRNSGVPNEGAFYVDHTGQVIYSAEAPKNLLTAEQASHRAAWRGSSTGAVMLSTEYAMSFDDKLPFQGEFSLYRYVVGAAVNEHEINSYDNGNRFFADIGTVRSWTTVAQTGQLQSHLHYPHFSRDVSIV